MAAGREAEPGADFPKELADRVHMSLLAGLLSHIGMKDTEAQPGRKRRGPVEFAGARGARFAIFPDSVLAEAARLGGRGGTRRDIPAVGQDGARIEPEWAEQPPPTWSSAATANALGRAARCGHGAGAGDPYGLPIVAARRVGYARADPAAARDIFITSALVEGDWPTHHQFFHRNQRLLEAARELEDRARRRGIVADDAVLFDFYDRRIPQDVTSARHFDTWWKKARAQDPDLLALTPADLDGPAAGQVRPADYPASWGELPLTYEFAPGEPGDGVTVDVPLAELDKVNAEEFGWQVPGRREELVTELIRSLPKDLRRAFVPAPDAARAVLARRLGEPHGSLLTALGAELGRLGGVQIPRDAWDLSRLLPHLRITFRVLDSIANWPGKGPDATRCA